MSILAIILAISCFIAGVVIASKGKVVIGIVFAAISAVIAVWLIISGLYSNPLVTSWLQ